MIEILKVQYRDLFNYGFKNHWTEYDNEFDDIPDAHRFIQAEKERMDGEYKFRIIKVITSIVVVGVD